MSRYVNKVDVFCCRCDFLKQACSQHRGGARARTQFQWFFRLLVEMRHAKKGGAR